MDDHARKYVGLVETLSKLIYSNIAIQPGSSVDKTDVFLESVNMDPNLVRAVIDSVIGQGDIATESMPEEWSVERRDLRRRQFLIFQAFLMGYLIGAPTE